MSFRKKRAWLMVALAGDPQGQDLIRQTPLKCPFHELGKYPPIERGSRHLNQVFCDI